MRESRSIPIRLASGPKIATLPEGGARGACEADAHTEGAPAPATSGGPATSPAGPQAKTPKELKEPKTPKTNPEKETLRIAVPINTLNPASITLP